jgi:hypothetical protein
VIDRWKKVLADKTAPAVQRRSALGFVVHFLGDIHQPLHCATHDDEGGNTVPVIYLGVYDLHVKLHQVWDDNLVTAVRGRLDPSAYAYKLHTQVSDKDKAEWEAAAAPRQWAKESHQLAKDVAYPPVIEQKWDAHHPVRIDSDYVNRAKPVVERQLMKAGVRLAKVLNDALDPAP